MPSKITPMPADQTNLKSPEKIEVSDDIVQSYFDKLVTNTFENYDENSNLARILINQEKRMLHGPHTVKLAILPEALSFIFETFGAWGIAPFAEMINDDSEQMTIELKAMIRDHLRKINLPGYNLARGEQEIRVAVRMLKARISIENKLQ